MDRNQEHADVVTTELIERLQTPAGGWTRAALAYLGVPWPPLKGWKARIINKPRKPLEGAPENCPIPGDRAQLLFPNVTPALADRPAER